MITEKNRIIRSVLDIAAAVGGRIKGDKSLVIKVLSPIESKTANSLTFLSNKKYLRHLYGVNNRAILCHDDVIDIPEIDDTLIIVDDVYAAWSIIQKLFQGNDELTFEISDRSVVASNVLFSPRVSIGHFVVIESGVTIGDETVIKSNAYIGKNVSIGSNVTIGEGVKIFADCKVGDNVTIQANSVIGSDGFGYHFIDGRYHKIPQTGNVIIEDFVEIGANVCIDRASIGSTIIRKGAILDNLIQIAHSVEVGEHVAIAAQAGISGSSKIGNYVQLGGQAGIAGHVKIAKGNKIQAQSGVAKDIKSENGKWYGYPILSYMNYLRSYALFKKLPEFIKRLQYLEKRINQMSEKDSQ